MKVFPIVLFGILLFSCNTPKDGFESKLSDIFFNANIDESYNGLVKYFRAMKNLNEIKFQGWTSYPPLSALGDTAVKPVSTLFEFNQHPKISSALQSGKLTVTKIGFDENASAALDIYFRFQSKLEAERLYKTIEENFHRFRRKQENTLANDIRWIEFGGERGIGGMTLTLFNSETDSIHTVAVVAIWQTM